MDAGMYYVAQSFADAMPPEESLKFVEAGMNLAGFNDPDPHLKELLRQLAYHEISYAEYDMATTQYILGQS